MHSSGLCLFAALFQNTNLTDHAVFQYGHIVEQVKGLEHHAHTATVGGSIEAMYPFEEEVCIICNEEGRIRELPYNCTICGAQFFGDIVLVGVKGDEFADLPLEFKEIKEMMPSLWEVSGQ